MLPIILAANLRSDPRLCKLPGNLGLFYWMCVKNVFSFKVNGYCFLPLQLAQNMESDFNKIYEINQHACELTSIENLDKVWVDLNILILVFERYLVSPELKNCLFVYLPIYSILELGGFFGKILYYNLHSVEKGQKCQHVVVLSDKSDNTVYH